MTEITSDTRVLTMPEIAGRIKEMHLPAVDLVVAIATGGIVPASLLAYQLEKPLAVLHINYRADDNRPRYETPQLLADIEIPTDCQRILLVDDVSVSGATMQLATQLLGGYAVTTFVLKGQGDLVALPDVDTCIHLPWRDW